MHQDASSVNVVAHLGADHQTRGAQGLTTGRHLADAGGAGDDGGGAQGGLHIVASVPAVVREKGVGGG